VWRTVTGAILVLNGSLYIGYGLVSLIGALLGARSFDVAADVVSIVGGLLFVALGSSVRRSSPTATRKQLALLLLTGAAGLYWLAVALQLMSTRFMLR
jgi:hypothetical protein